MEGLKKRGFSEGQALGIAAGIHAESASNPNAKNPTSGAMGLGQWLGPRKEAIRKRFGGNPTLEQQLDFLADELRGGDAGGKYVLSQSEPAKVLDAYVRKFMRPAAGAETDGDIARGMAALGQAPSTTTPEGPLVPESTTQFVNALVPTNERASMILADGSIAKGLVARMEAALLVRAFGQRPFIEKMVDATDSNVRAIGKALVEMAGKFAKLREAAQDERVDPVMDITGNIAEAVEIIERARREGKPIGDYVNQRDIFSGSTVDPMTEAALRTFFFARPDFTKPLGQQRIVDAMSTARRS